MRADFGFSLCFKANNKDANNIYKTVQHCTNVVIKRTIMYCLELHLKLSMLAKYGIITVTDTTEQISVCCPNKIYFALF